MITLDDTLDALAYLTCGTQHPQWHKDLGTCMPKEFDGFELLSQSDDSDIDRDPGVLVQENVLDFPIWPVDISIGHKVPGPQDLGHDTGTWQFLNFKTLDIRKWRGRLSISSPKMLEMRVLWTYPDGTMHSELKPIALFLNRAMWASMNRLENRGGGGDAPPAYFGGRNSHQPDSDYTNLVRLIGGFALRRYYQWSVLLGEEGSPRARWITDPIGIREAFKLRDIPEGEQRRKALLNWVREHWRRKRDWTANDVTWIKKHLRGQWSYNWNGFLCQIEPPESELKTLFSDD